MINLQRRWNFVVLFILSILTFQMQTAYSMDCPGSFFDCGNGHCIADFFLCDQDNDCGNFRDEMNCTSSLFLSGGDPINILKNSFCPPDKFACNDTMNNCIPKRWVCDGNSECANSADEANCTMEKDTCMGDFKCGSLECIPPTWVCDGVTDCNDASDEKNCTKYQEPLNEFCDKAHNKFRCLGGKCIDYHLVCNGVKDCPFNDDENNVCHFQKCQDKKCSHFCRIDATTKEPVCYCPPGYVLIYNKTCIDYDECAENKLTNICSQKCINIPGSYKCECHDGYRLVNQTGCEVEGPSPLLYFSTGTDIHGLNLGKNILFPVQESKFETIIAISVWPEKKNLYYSTYSNDSTSSSSVYEISIDPSSVEWSRTEPKRIFHDVNSQVEGLSIDWLGNHVYITEFNKSRIVVCNTDSLICATLIGNLPAPRGILVLPSKGKLFWTQWDKNNGIYEAAMDGSDRSILFGDVDWPNDLVFDEVKNRLYWVEGKIGRIEYYDFDTEIRHLVIEDKWKQPYSIFVFEDYVYWSDWISNSLYSCEKIGCHHNKMIFHSTFSSRSARRIYGISMYHPKLIKSPSSVSNPCQNHPCSHLCLIKNNVSYTCFCPDHAFLLSDNKTCVDKDEYPFLIVSTGLKFYKYFPHLVEQPFEEIPIQSDRYSIADFTYNPQLKEIFVYDRFKDQILMASLKMYYIQFKILVDYNIGSVFGMNYDINTDNLYWVDMVKGTLEVVHVNNSLHAILNEKLDQPISMAINAPKKTIYVGLKTKHGQIVALTMDGQIIRTIMKTETGLPMAMVTYQNGQELIWGDPILQRIDFVNLTIKKTIKSKHRNVEKLAENHVGTVQSLAIINSTIYWTNADSQKLYSTSLTSTLKAIDSKRIPGKILDSDYLQVVSGVKQEPLYDYCLKNNTCDHICLIGNDGPICKCSIGYESSDNGRNCTRILSSASSNLKPFSHILNLGQIFDFILSKQKDSAADTWIDTEDLFDEEVVSTTLAPLLIESETNELKKINTFETESATSSEPESTSTSLIYILYLFFIISCLIIIIVLLCLKLPVLRNGRIGTMMEYVRQQMRITKQRDDGAKQVRFFTNPNYNPNFARIPKTQQQQQPQSNHDTQLLVD